MSSASYLPKILSDLAKGGLIAFFVALAVEKRDPYVGGFAIIGAVNLYGIAHNLPNESGNHD